MNGIWLILFLLIWYPGIGFFFWWFVWLPIKTGEAGSSGSRLLRNEQPIDFWATVLWSLFWLLAMAALPIAKSVARE